MLFERPEAGGKAVLLQVELRAKTIRIRMNSLSLPFGPNRCCSWKALSAMHHIRDGLWEAGVDELKELLQWSGASLLLVNHDYRPGSRET